MYRYIPTFRRSVLLPSSGMKEGGCLLEDGCSMLLRNVGVCFQVNTAL
jgi:hypothetical protein